MESSAVFSPNRTYRYMLSRTWDGTMPKLAVIGLNPSTADEHVDDPTIRKVIGFAERLNCGGIIMLNVGAFRATDPKEWRRALDPIGPGNKTTDLFDYILDKNVARLVAAWGPNGKYAAAQCKAIRTMFPVLWCWGVTSGGYPRHPLMLPYSTQLVRYE